MKKKVANNFVDFLREFRVVSAAIGFVFALATNELIQSFVDNIMMPLLDPLIKDGTWETAVLNIGPIQLAWGVFLSTFLHFVIIILLIYIVIKKVMKYSPKK